MVGQRGDAGRSRPVQWIGRSGRPYQLVAEALDKFALRDLDLYVIAKGSLPLWVGSTDELVSDPLSRTRFRLALDCATEVWHLEQPQDRMAVIWDLEGAVPASDCVAQAA